MVVLISSRQVALLALSWVAMSGTLHGRMDIEAGISPANLPLDDSHSQDELSSRFRQEGFEDL